MGVFEWEAFRSGTATVADAMARSSAFRVAGGGDSVAALRMLGREADLDHLSTGGGAGHGTAGRPDPAGREGTGTRIR